MSRSRPAPHRWWACPKSPRRMWRRKSPPPGRRRHSSECPRSSSTWTNQNRRVKSEQFWMGDWPFEQPPAGVVLPEAFEEGHLLGDEGAGLLRPAHGVVEGLVVDSAVVLVRFVVGGAFAVVRVVVVFGADTFQAGHGAEPSEGRYGAAEGSVGVLFGLGWVVRWHVYFVTEVDAVDLAKHNIDTTSWRISEGWYLPGVWSFSFGTCRRWAAHPWPSPRSWFWRSSPAWRASPIFWAPFRTGPFATGWRRGTCPTGTSVANRRPRLPDFDSETRPFDANGADCHWDRGLWRSRLAGSFCGTGDKIVYFRVGGGSTVRSPKWMRMKLTFCGWCSGVHSFLRRPSPWGSTRFGTKIGTPKCIEFKINISTYLQYLKLSLNSVKFVFAYSK